MLLLALLWRLPVVMGLRESGQISSFVPFCYRALSRSYQSVGSGIPCLSLNCCVSLQDCSLFEKEGRPVPTQVDGSMPLSQLGRHAGFLVIPCKSYCVLNEVHRSHIYTLFLHAEGGDDTIH